MTTIRHANRGDVDQIVELMREAHAGTGFDDPNSAIQIPLNLDCIRSMTIDHVVHPRKCCLILAVDGTARGVLAASLEKDILGPTIIARETVWWVTPTHRTLSAAKGMLQNYEEWAQHKGASFVSMASKRDKRTDALYRRSGYLPATMHFVKKREGICQ